jgi:limonene-1,2-epoxide hydrolase
VSGPPSGARGICGQSGAEYIRGDLRRPSALGLLLIVVAAGCGGGSPSPESVVRAWSVELNAGDNEAAADLVARNATIIQGDTIVTLRTREDAIEWNAALPCSGQIVAIRTSGERAVATFLLGDREESKCDGPGEKATAVFRVRKGKIVLWHQTTMSKAPEVTV